MFSLGPPLGWGESFQDNLKRQEKFFNGISGELKTYNEHSDLFFNDMLDHICM
jgi:hypothetical protein